MVEAGSERRPEGGSELLLRQVVVIVWPGLGIGPQADAGERGANSLAHAAAYVGGLDAPLLQWLGLGNVHAIRGLDPAEPPAASYGRVARKSPSREAGAAFDELFGTALREVAAAGRSVHCVGPTRDFLGGERPRGLHVHTDEGRSSLELLADLVVREREGLFVGAPRASELPQTACPVAAARALRRLDGELTRLIDRAQGRDDVLVIVTSSGGSDTVLPMRNGPTRELVPVLAYTPAVPSGIALGDRESLADIGATAAEVFGVHTASGLSFLGDLLA